MSRLLTQLGLCKDRLCGVDALENLYVFLPLLRAWPFALMDDRRHDRQDLLVSCHFVCHFEAPLKGFLEVIEQFAARQRREGVTAHA